LRRFLSKRNKITRKKDLKLTKDEKFFDDSVIVVKAVMFYKIVREVDTRKFVCGIITVVFNNCCLELFSDLKLFI
jgi:hypothetical protein